MRIILEDYNYGDPTKAGYQGEVKKIRFLDETIDRHVVEWEGTFSEFIEQLRQQVKLVMLTPYGEKYEVDEFVFVTGFGSFHQR